jgi:hypothetical protein
LAAENDGTPRTSGAEKYDESKPEAEVMLEG